MFTMTLKGKVYPAERAGITAAAGSMPYISEPILLSSFLVLTPCDVASKMYTI